MRSITINNNSLTIVNGKVTGLDTVIEGNGNVIRKKLTLNDFTKIESLAPVDIICEIGGSTGFELECEENIIALLSITTDTGKLNINTTGSISITKPIKLFCSVKMIDSVISKSSGNICINSISQKKIKLTIMGSGDIVVSGNAEFLIGKVMGSGSIDCNNLVASDGDLVIMGSGNIASMCIESVQASIMGSGSINILGDPADRMTDILGSGKINFVSS